MRGRDARRGVGVAFGLALVFGACGQPARLDVEKVESHLDSHLSEVYSVAVAGVACPESIEVEAGTTFRCTVTFKGDLRVGTTVEQTDDDGSLQVNPDAAILSTAVVEDEIATTLADRFERPEVEVTCDGAPVRAQEPDSSFECEAVDGDETKTVTVRVRDIRGALTYTLAEQTAEPPDEASGG